MTHRWRGRLFGVEPSDPETPTEETFMPETIADEIADERRRLATIAAERAADDPVPDPAGWRRREADRAAMESATATRIESLITGATNDAALDRPRPAIRPDRCCGCDRRIAFGSAIMRPDGPCCGSCVSQSPAERALHRSVRSVTIDELPRYLDDLPAPELSDAFHLVTGNAPRDAHDLRRAVHDAVRRRRRRTESRHSDFQMRRRRIVEKVNNSAAAGTTHHTTAGVWGDLNATLHPALAPATHLDEPATREVLDRLDRAALQDLRRLTARVRDITGEAVIVAELRRRR